MSILESLGRVIETDVLVIGGGVAGLWAANKAREFVERVTVVDKGPRDWGGQASRSGGAMVAAISPDQPEDFIKDLVYYYDGLCDQALWTEIFKRSSERLEDYQRLGYEFIALPDGRPKGIPQRGLDHIKCYLGKPFGMGGKNMVAVLVNEARRLGIERLGRIVITDLLRDGDAVIGAVGFDQINGQFYLFIARAVVLAVGNGGWKTSYHHNTCAGDAVYLGLKAGAEATNCEFARVWNMPKLFSWEGQTYLLPLGARFVNAKGESFMDRYSPVLGANTDPHYITRAMALEARAGRGPFYLDCTPMKPEDRELVTPKGAGWMELNYLKLRDMGMSFFEDKLEWVAQMRLSVMGIAADAEGRTKVPGLFVTGRARATDPTVYVGGLSLCLCAVTGYASGESAGTYAGSQTQPSIDAVQVAELKASLYKPLGKIGILPKELLREIQESVFPCDVSILKHDTSLTRALGKLNRIEAELFQHMAAPDPHYLMKLMEIRSIHLMSELYVRASRMRTESRAGHYRDDYPERDDAKWLGQIMVSLDRDTFSLRFEPLPMDRYSIKPTRYYSDNFTFPRPASPQS
jgi:succinate dehydrogenase / fumarate reductase, flavoprotein subunit